MLLTIRSILSLVVVSVCSTFPALANQYHCPESPEILLSAPDHTMVEYVCTAAARTTEFLGNYGLIPKRLISLKIIDKEIDQDGYMAYGSYDRQSDRILLMSLPALLQSNEAPRMYDMPFDEEQYIGAIAHELTHAIFHHNASNVEEKWNNAAQEYLAHATQLGVLPLHRQEEIIRSADTGPWESGDEISVTYMGFNPTGFAVKSYLHLTRMTDPQPFIQILLDHKWLYISVP